MCDEFEKFRQEQLENMIEDMVISAPKPKMELKHFHIGEEEIAGGVIQSIIEPLWWSVNIYDSAERYYEDLAPFSLPQRYIFAIQWYLAETYNGGHDQFFFNSTGIVWREALEGFKAAGLDGCADILSEAARRMGGEPSPDREQRWSVMEELQPEFDDLDSRLYGMDEQAVYKAMTAYITANKQAFFFDGSIEVPVYDK